jgi:hypothetical protein
MWACRDCPECRKRGRLLDTDGAGVPEYVSASSTTFFCPGSFHLPRSFIGVLHKQPSKSEIVVAGGPQLKSPARETHEVHSTIMSSEFNVTRKRVSVSKNGCASKRASAKGRRDWHAFQNREVDAAHSGKAISFFIQLLDCWPAAAGYYVGYWVQE